MKINYNREHDTNLYTTMHERKLRYPMRKIKVTKLQSCPVFTGLVAYMDRNQAYRAYWTTCRPHGP